MTVLLVSLGALVGAPARYLTDRAVQTRLGSAFPWGTLAVNLVASLVLGVLLGAGTSADPGLVSLVGTGFCGALSTYSTFSFETLRLHQRGAAGSAIGYLALSVAGGLGVAAAGWAMASAAF